MKLPVHRWFRYSAGFSAEWVEELIKKHQARSLKILDPFAGSGTTLVAAESCGVSCAGFETHPFIYRVAKIKINRNIAIEGLREKIEAILMLAKNDDSRKKLDQIPLLKKCYSKENLDHLERLREAYRILAQPDDDEWELLWLGITGILRRCSSAGTAQWQYVLPKKKKAKVADVFAAFQQNMEMIISDIQYAHYHNWTNSASIYSTDARNPEIDSEDQFDLVITSPPYPNNYDYADATRLEMTFWGDIQGWKDLQPAVRQYLIHSCSQHAAAEKLKLEDLLDQKFLEPVYDELTEACRELEKIRLTKGGKKTYHTMAAAYFLDLAKVFHSLRKLCRNGARLCFVVGDSAPYGVYLPVDKWLGKLALQAGFNTYRFEKIRDRNVKWKNRKHTVPLHEGRLWIEG